MGRQKTYDPAQALAAAVDAFWKTGFAGTSMRTLVTATGVNPKSLYAEFGDKEQLFLTATNAYIAEQALLYGQLAGEPFGLQRVRDHFGAYRFDKKFKGCLLINSLAENNNIPAAAQDRIDVFFRSVKKLFGQHLSAAREAGEIKNNASISGLSEALVVFDQGLAIAGKSPKQRPHLQRAAVAFLDAISAPGPVT